MSMTLNGIDLEDPDGRWGGFTAVHRGRTVQLSGWVVPILRPDFFEELRDGRVVLKASDPKYLGVDGTRYHVIPRQPVAPGLHPHGEFIDWSRPIEGWSYILQEAGRKPVISSGSHVTYAGNDPAIVIEVGQCCYSASEYGMPLAPDGSLVAADYWYPNTSDGGAPGNTAPLSDADDATSGVEDYPSGFAVMYYDTAFSATAVFMRQKAGEDTIPIGGFGKNSARAWHLDAWPDSLGSPPATGTDWVPLGGVTIARFNGYSQEYAANLSGAPASAAYRLAQDAQAYVGPDSRNSWVIYEFELYEGGIYPRPLPAEMADLVRFPVGGTATYTAIEEFSAGYVADNAASGYKDTTSTATGISWAAIGWSSGDWWQVDWTVAQGFSRVILHDRGGAGDFFGTNGRLTFSDGSTVTWSGLTDGGALTIDFARKTGITWMRVISDAGGTTNAGLAEVEAFDA